MKYFVSLLFLIISAMPIKAQSLDYARDVFFYDFPLVSVKNFYYQYSPLLAMIQDYGGKGLSVVVVCQEKAPIAIARKNIELESFFEQKRPYLRDLRFFYSTAIFRDFLKNNVVDMIIIEETFSDEVADIIIAHPNEIMIFNGDGKLLTNPKSVTTVRNWWHYNFRMDDISKELIKVWHSKEKYRTFLLFMERSKNLSISVHKRVSVILFFLILGVIIISGFYYRLKLFWQKRFFLGICATLFLLTAVFVCFNFLKYQEFVNDVYSERANPPKSLPEVLVALENQNVLKKVAALRSITERLIVHEDQEYFKQHMAAFAESMKIYIDDKDERVRMWSIAVITQLNEESLINFLASKQWEQEESYLVRTRVIRALATLENQNTNAALLQIAKFEKHPYVFTELREICLERKIWAKGESIDANH